MYKSNYISIEGLGDFGMTEEIMKKRIRNDEKQRQKRILYHRKKRQERYYQNRLLKSRMKRFNKINARRALSNLKPLKYSEFVVLTKKKKPRKLRTVPKFNYTFDILDTHSEPK